VTVFGQAKCRILAMADVPLMVLVMQCITLSVHLCTVQRNECEAVILVVKLVVVIVRRVDWTGEE